MIKRTYDLGEFQYVTIKITLNVKLIQKKTGYQIVFKKTKVNEKRNYSHKQYETVEERKKYHRQICTKRKPEKHFNIR